MDAITAQDLQHLHDPLSLIEAAGHLINARLTCISTPPEPETWICSIGEHQAETVTLLLQAIETLRHALRNQQLQAAATQAPSQSRMDKVGCRTKTPRQRPDPLIAVSELKRWLSSHQLFPPYFFEQPVPPDYLNPQHPRYAPKLALAIRAWQATHDTEKCSPKQALESSLRIHAAAFGLVNADGQPINQVIEECGKVANWQPQGGAPKSGKG